MDGLTWCKVSFAFIDSTARSTWAAATTQQAQLEGLRDEWAGQMSVRYYSAADAHLATVTHETPIVDTSTTPYSLRLGAYVAQTDYSVGVAAYCVLAVPAGADILRADCSLAGPGGEVTNPGGRVRLDIGTTLRVQATASLPAGEPDIQITGTTWTPNVDGDDNVLATDFAQLPLNTWVYANTNTMDAVIPYPRLRRKQTGADGSFNITSAWCSATWDYINQILHFRGGGHATSNIAENGSYGLRADTLRFYQSAPRSTEAAMMRWEAATGGQAGLQPISIWSDPRNESGNCPQTDGLPPSSHTYHGLPWIPSTVMGNTYGGIVDFTWTVALCDLDTQRYDVPWFDGTQPSDYSYKNCFVDGWIVYYWRGNEQIRRWDFTPGQREPTLWSQSLYNVVGSGFSSPHIDNVGQNSRGVRMSTINSGAYIHYSKKATLSMPQRRMFVVLAAHDSGLLCRVRYGAAIDAAATNWATYIDALTMTSSDGSHLEFTDARFDDVGGGQPLYEAGCCFDDATGDAYIVPNAAGEAIYKLTGATSGSVLTVEKLTSTAVLTSAGNGTFQKAQLFTRGGAKFIVRVSSTTSLPEVCRVS